MAVGYIGLGSMGGALARRLQLAEPLTVYDMNAAAVGRLVAAGAQAAGSGAEVAASCMTVMLCLPTSQHVEDLLYGRGDLARHLRPGAIVIDQTTGDPSVTRALARRLRQADVSMLDAPVSGGPVGAEAGTIAIMVGGPAEDYARAAPLLHKISPNVVRAGEIGTGNVIKLANNMLSAAQRFVAMEAVALAVKNGVDAGRAVQIINKGSGRNFFTELMFEKHIVSGNLPSGFTLGLLHKDVKLACQLGAETGVAMQFGDVAKNFLQMAMNAYSYDTQVNAAALMMDSLCGTHVVPENHSL
ncbi:MAG: NAD(P)-dependent oxidoreductase [Rhodobacteraceae bacterium]|jgi:3-hydroxyisobutyrate dehydrogenase|nr:NAD(P)-dependent oxidoreductase [Paracoccaceae bacterium]